MKENILKIPYSAVNNNWDFLHKYLNKIGNPRYIIIGDVDLSFSNNIYDLDNLIGVDGNLDLAWSDIKSLGELEFVIGKLNLLGCSKIKNLGNIKRVKEISLRLSSVQSLSKLEEVNGDLNLTKCYDIETLGNLKKVDGDLDLSYSPIESLGNLEFVGKNLYLYKTQINPAEFDKVQIVGNIIK